MRSRAVPWAGLPTARDIQCRQPRSPHVPLRWAGVGEDTLKSIRPVLLRIPEASTLRHLSVSQDAHHHGAGRAGDAHCSSVGLGRRTSRHMLGLAMGHPPWHRGPVRASLPGHLLRRTFGASKGPPEQGRTRGCDCPTRVLQAGWKEDGFPLPLPCAGPRWPSATQGVGSRRPARPSAFAWGLHPWLSRRPPLPGVPWGPTQ